MTIVKTPDGKYLCGTCLRLWATEPAAADCRHAAPAANDYPRWVLRSAVAFAWLMCLITFVVCPAYVLWSIVH